MGHPEGVRRRTDAGRLLHISNTKTNSVHGTASHASQGRGEMGADVCVSDPRTVYIHARDTIRRGVLQSTGRARVHQSGGYSFQVEEK